jgi:rhodanese-related sulfurtransferase
MNQHIIRISRQRVAVACVVLLVAVAHAYASGGPESYDAYLETLYRGTVAVVSAEDLAARLLLGEEIIVLDVRSRSERAVSAIPGSVFIDFDTFTVGEFAGIAGDDLDTAIVAYCAVGYRSERVGEKLIEAGYRNVRHLYGGIIEWQNRGNEIERGPAHPDTEDALIHGYSPRWGKWVTAEELVVYEPAVED